MLLEPFAFPSRSVVRTPSKLADTAHLPGLPYLVRRDQPLLVNRQVLDHRRVVRALRRVPGPSLNRERRR